MEQDELLFVRPEVILTRMETPAADVPEGDAIECIDDNCNHEPQSFAAEPQRQFGSLGKMRILIRLRLDSKEIMASPVQIHAVRAVLHQGMGSLHPVPSRALFAGPIRGLLCTSGAPAFISVCGSVSEERFCASVLRKDRRPGKTAQGVLVDLASLVKSTC